MNQQNTNGPPKNVILDDLDQIEKEREAVHKSFALKTLFFPGREGDVLLWRRLFRFARPYTAKILLCVLLSSVVGGALGAKFFFFQKSLEPILDPKGTAKNAVVEDGFFDRFSIFDPSPETGAGEKEADKPIEDEPAPEELSPQEKSLLKNRLVGLIMLFLMIVLIEQTSVYFQNIMIRSVGHRIIMDIRNALFARVMSLSMKFHNKNHSGKLISRLTNDLLVFGAFFTHTAVDFSRDVFQLMACVIYVVMTSGWSFIGIAAIFGLAFLPIQAIGRSIRKKDKMRQRSTSLIYAALSESFAGHKIIKAFGMEEHEYEKFRKVSNKTYRDIMKVARLRSRTRPVVELSGSLILAIFVFFLGFQVIEVKMSAPEMFMTVAALVFAIGPIRRLARANNHIQTAFASADRVATLLYSEPEIQDIPDANELTSFDKEIRYDHVFFEHDQNIPVLKEINFTVNKGEIVALVGPSGSGKTTLVDLLPRFYDVVNGKIAIDGTDIRRLTIKSLRSQIGIVSQETILFNDTVHMNIAYGMPDCGMDRIIEAAKAANAHDFITQMEDGYETQIGERGVRLSGGQKQRIAIARALLKNPPILILDEATSSLDSEAERQVQEALFRLMKGRTTLIIAHRLSTVRDADKILVIKNNRIVESGRHEELLALNGTYTKLHNLQS